MTLPDTAAAHCDTGLSLLDQGNYTQAIQSFERALLLDEDLVSAKYHLGVCLRHLRQYQRAVMVLQALKGVTDVSFDVDLELGLSLLGAGQFSRSTYLLKKVLGGAPDSFVAQQALGSSLVKQGNLEEAVQSYRAAQELKPDDALVAIYLGDAYRLQLNLVAAADSYRNAISRDPAQVQAYHNLGNALQGLLQLDEALQVFEKAVDIAPDIAELHTSVGNIHMALGDPELAIAAYRKALERCPGYPLGHSNLAMTLVYLPGVSEAEILQEHKAWARDCCSELQVRPDFPNTRERSRKLRIGYLSSNFYFHPVTTFFWPLIEAVDRERFEIYCYYNNSPRDGVTQQIKKLADHWRETMPLNDDQLEQVIRNDEVDILVDLSGHTANNRLPIFARRVAPVQVSFIGYACTTGLSEMDYFITDSKVDPDRNEMHYTEELVRIPTFSCYQAWPGSPEVGPLPVHSQGHITFGSLNNPEKFHDELISLWSCVLKAVPGSTFVMQGKSFGSESVIRLFSDKFMRNGIERKRLKFNPPMPFEQHMELYNSIDIALDTHPWNGHTTTCHALWMGCPVVAMWGTRHAARMAGGVLTAIGLEELVANNREEFVQIAVDLAGNIGRLAGLRSSMRERMKSSPLCDQKTFQSHLEKKYLQMWERWCDSNPAGNEAQV